MNVRRFALVLGIIYIIVGVAGFFPPLLSGPPADVPGIRVTTLYGYLLGLFPVNILHTLFHLAIGIWGVIAANAIGRATLYAKSIAIIYGILTIMGLIGGGLNTVFGLLPLHGHDVWLHAITAAVAAYFGFFAGAVQRTGEHGEPSHGRR